MLQPVRRLALALFAATLSLPALGLTVHATPAAAQISYTSPKYAAIVVDANSGEVLYGSRADSPRYPASITKVMTLYLTFEALEQGRLRLTDQIIISPRAAAQSPSKLGLRAGEQISVDNAIRAVAVKSSNDIAVALAEKIGGTESRFAALMTLRAQELGMTRSRFVNANGLPDSRQLSSARDIALLSRAVMRDYPQYYTYFGQRYFEYRGQALRNHNGLLHRMPGVDGIKTGFINASGFNLAASAVRDGRRLIAVVMGGPSTASRDNHVQELLSAGFNVMRRRAAGDAAAQVANYLPAGVATRYAVAGSTEQGSYLPTPPARGQASTVTYASLPTPTLTVAPAAIAPWETRAVVKPAPKRAKPAPVKAAEARPTSKPIALAKADLKPKESAAASVAAAPSPSPTGEWLVQVGAYKEEAPARDRLAQVVRRWASYFKKGSGSVAQGNGHYRVRFAGYSAEEAKAACKALTGTGEPCMALRAG